MADEFFAHCRVDVIQPTTQCPILADYTHSLQSRKNPAVTRGISLSCLDSIPNEICITLVVRCTGISKRFGSPLQCTEWSDGGGQFSGPGPRRGTDAGLAQRQHKTRAEPYKQLAAISGREPKTSFWSLMVGERGVNGRTMSSFLAHWKWFSHCWTLLIAGPMLAWKEVATGGNRSASSCTQTQFKGISEAWKAFKWFLRIFENLWKSFYVISHRVHAKEETLESLKPSRIRE